MKAVLLGALVLIGSFAGAARADRDVLGPPTPDPKLEELWSLPSALTVAHAPDSVSASFAGPGGSRWTHSTTVSVIENPVTILEFGYLVERDGHWVFASESGSPYAPEDFARWYDCPGAVLQPGKTYTDASNESMKDRPAEQQLSPQSSGQSEGQLQ